VPFTEIDILNFPSLSDAESAERLRRDGFNELPSATRRGVVRIAADVVREPMILLLVACGVVYLLLGDFQDAVILLAWVGVVIGISLYQNHKTERALDALRDLSSPRALVIRGGRERRIAGREVVRGDLIALSEGDRVPADGVVLWSLNLTVDESLLSGESVPVRKAAGDETADMQRPGGDDSPFVFSGTLVVAGQGIARVKATAARTEFGKIGKALETTDRERTNLEREIARLVRVVAAAGLFLCAIVAVLYGLTRQSWLEGLLAGLALAMAMLPEEFPVILTIFLALGAWRISQHRVLTRRLPAIEALGSATVACVDKTGTITQNRMSVSTLSVHGRQYEVQAHRDEPLPEELHSLVEFALLASQEKPFDPMEQAINEFGKTRLSGTEHLHDTWILVQEYPLSRSLLAMSHVWQSRDGEAYVIGAKGAPEAVADLCHLDAPRLRSLERDMATLAEKGLRVLGVAGAVFQRRPLPVAQHDFNFEFLGLIALSDPVRPRVREAMRQCYGAGIRTVMITGDSAATARNIAAQIGLTPRDDIITGPELDTLNAAELAHRMRAVNVFARVVPEQKLRLVNALKATGEVVAMTGDGVNDAPALKAAHIGIAMGERGTDVAREAAALVLLDDDFSSIVQAVRLGRRVFDNIKKAMAYVLAIHVPIAGLSLIPAVLNWPLILLPLHIAFLELIIDPACSIAFEAEPEEADVMDRPPRNPDEPLFHQRTIWASLLQGCFALVLVLGILMVARGQDYGENRARTLAFSTLVLINLGLILANRSSSRSSFAAMRIKNRALWWVVSGALLVLVFTLAWPPLRAAFRFATPSYLDVGVTAAAGLAGVLGFDVLKTIGSTRNPRAPDAPRR
jgi:Ca2+-transporting ATPase